MIIAVSGPAGSGKTTQALKLAKHFGLKYHSAGMIFREIAREQGISIEELSRIAASDPSIDVEIDRRTMEKAAKDNIVIDGHLAAWILMDTADVKILVTAPLDIRIKRIAERDGKSFEEAMKETIRREYLQARRFLEYYGLEPWNSGFFDIVIDTSRMDPDETFEVLREAIGKILKTNGGVMEKGVHH